MNKLLAGAIAIAMCTMEVAAADVAPKPLLPGFHPDPSVCLGHDGAYYIVTSSFMWQPALPIYRSEDFREWSLVGHALADFSAFDVDGLHDDDGVWAPTIRFHDGTYYIAFTFHGEKTRNYIVTAKDAAGPWSRPIHIEEGDGGIDPSIFFDEPEAGRAEGKCYWCQESTARKQEWRGHTEIWVQELDLAQMRLVGRREYISSGVFPNAKNAEGPHIYKIGNDYLLIHAEGGTSFDHAATAMKAKSVFGTYTPLRTNPLITRRDRGIDSPLQATGHADIVRAKGETNRYWAVFLGKRPIGEDHRVVLGRETFACPAIWRDGEMVFEDRRMIEGRIVTPEEECEVLIPGAKVRRVRDWVFDETVEAKDGEAMILYHSADAKITLDGPGRLRMKSDDGLTIQCYRDGELVKEESSKVICGRHTRFNGLGVGIVKWRE